MGPLVQSVILSLVAGSLAIPEPPPLTYLYRANLTFANSTLLAGISPLGNRTVFTISGGTFSGPRLQGIVRIGLDWGLADQNKTFREDTVYTLQTDDGAGIVVRARGLGNNVHHTFDTGSAKYSWLNYVTGYAAGVSFKGGVGLEVWQVGP